MDGDQAGRELELRNERLNDPQTEPALVYEQVHEELVLDKNEPECLSSLIFKLRLLLLLLEHLESRKHRSL